jgi:RNA-directed DNA polymerase
MSLPPPLRVEKLQTALHTKAKKSPDYRFYALYDKVYRGDVLEWAYYRCRANGGAPGVDGQTFDDIEAYGLDRWLDELAEDLKKRTYCPQPVRRVYIPKPDGKQRPLGIPCIVDRVAQMATVLVLEPIFEADLEPEQYGYRPGRSALDAVRQVERLARSGHTEVVDGDLSGDFDAIPHAELLKSLSRRISDRFVMKLIKMWLEAPVEETDARGHRHRTTRNKDEGRGSPQGSPISPLLSNIYMLRFVKGWKTGGHEKRLKARIVNYADDFVICCRGTADDAMTVMPGMMSKLKLTVNETKTRLCRLPEESFDFLGYTIGRCHSLRTGEAYIGPRPSRKSIDRRDDGTAMGIAPGRLSGRRDQQETEGLGELFSAGHCAASLPARRQPRAVPASSMVEGQVQGPRAREDTVPQRLLVSRPGALQPPGMARCTSSSAPTGSACGHGRPRR